MTPSGGMACGCSLETMCSTHAAELRARSGGSGAGPLMVLVRDDDLDLLLDRVVFLNERNVRELAFQPDTLSEIEPDLLEAVARCVRAQRSAREAAS